MYSMRATAKLWGQVGALEDIVTTGGNKQCLHSFTHKSGSCGTWYSFQVKLHVWLEQWKMTFIPVGLVSFIVSMNSNAWVTLQGVQGATLGLRIFFNTLQTLTLKSLTQWDHIPLKKQKHLISHSWMLRHGPWVLNFDSLFYILSFIFSRSSICCLVSLYLYYNVTSTSVFVFYSLSLCLFPPPMSDSLRVSASLCDLCQVGHASPVLLLHFLFYFGGWCSLSWVSLLFPRLIINYPHLCSHWYPHPHCPVFCPSLPLSVVELALMVVFLCSAFSLLCFGFCALHIICFSLYC